MDDLAYGTRNKRGDWKPSKPAEYPPVFAWPAKPLAFGKWLLGFNGYILPWNLLYALVAFGIWRFLTPSFEWLRSGDYWWVAYLLARNAIMALVVYGAWHFALYMKKTQGGDFKYNAKWPSTDNKAYLFGRQNADNIIWTFLSAVPIWTAYEAGMLWLFAHHYIPFVDAVQHPFYFVLIMLLIPMFHDLHFYIIHRVLHWPPLYRMVHSLHHNNSNPGPWSGLAMHPIEHLLYFSGVLIHIVVPSHPVHVLFHLYMPALGPAQSHAGFDKVLVGEKAVVETHGFRHYLHHKYFECNYGDGPIPIDKWFGTFHDGSAEAQVVMDNRFRQRMASATTKKLQA